MDKQALITSLLSDATNLPHRNDVKLNLLLNRARMLIVKVFSEKSIYLQQLDQIAFYPMALWDSMPDSHYDKSWNGGKSEFENLCRTMLEDINISSMQENLTTSAKASAVSEAGKSISDKKVFVVHGHDSEMKEAVARMLSKLELEPIILHEQPDQGRTVIEKFEDHSDVGFAVVLLSGDDLAFPRIGVPEDARPRARQNVILELGVFLGKLGRNRVLPLYRKVNKFELPSDYEGVLYKEFDSAGGWKVELFRELKAAGYEVDANKLV